MTAQNRTPPLLPYHFPTQHYSTMHTSPLLPNRNATDRNITIPSIPATTLPTKTLLTQPQRTNPNLNCHYLTRNVPIAPFLSGLHSPNPQANPAVLSKFITIGADITSALCSNTNVIDQSVSSPL